MGSDALSEVFQNDTFDRPPFWWCLTSGRVLGGQFAGQTGCSASKTERLDDPWARQMEGQVTDLKRRIPILRRLIADCDRLAGDLDQEELGTRRTVSKSTIPPISLIRPMPKRPLRDAKT